MVSLAVVLLVQALLAMVLLVVVWLEMVSPVLVLLVVVWLAMVSPLLVSLMVVCGCQDVSLVVYLNTDYYTLALSLCLLQF